MFEPGVVARERLGVQLSCRVCLARSRSWLIPSTTKIFFLNYKKKKKERKSMGWVWWCMPIVPGTQVTEIGGPWSKAGPGKSEGH
jgi:hypothetical protein